MSFKVGDRVVATNKCNSSWIGHVLTVIGPTPGRGGVVLQEGNLTTIGKPRNGIPLEDFLLLVPPELSDEDAVLWAKIAGVL